MPEPAYDVKKVQKLKRNYYLDPSWKNFYKTSSVLFILTGIIWVAVWRTASLLYSSGVPTDATAYLQLISKNQALAACTWGLWIVADLLIVPPIISLYLILRNTTKTLSLIGTALALVFPIFDISVSEINSLGLVSLAHAYASTTSAATQALYVAAATYGLALLSLETFMSYALSIGFVVLSVAMLKSFFRRGTAVFGIIAMGMATVGSVSVLVPSSIGLGLLFFVSLPTAGLWLILVGAQLYTTARIT
jgi:hypothetical protein